MRVNIDVSVCRVCLQGSEEVMTSIYDKDDSNVSIVMKIETCGGIKITDNPDFPTKICMKCNAFLSIAHKFRIMCRNSDNYLHEFVAKSGWNDIEDTPVEEKKEIKSLVITRSSPKPYNLRKTADYIPNYAKDDSDKDDDRNNSVDSSNDDDDIDNGAYSDDSVMDTKDELEPMKTLAMCADGTAIIETNRKQTHICEVCGNTYERRYCLEAHMRRHRGEKPFECEICKKAFALNFQLTRHMRSHTGQRPYKCKYCDRTFADRSTNVKHERIHTNERPYKCETCGKSFTYSNVLKVHLMTHTGEKPYTCELCGKRFSQLHHLRAHLQTLQHQNDPMASKLLLKSEPFT